MPQIETLFRTRINYDADFDLTKAIEDEAFRRAGGVEVESFSGNPACEPYLTAESESYVDLYAWQAHMLDFIKATPRARLTGD